MGQRMEVYLPASKAEKLIAIAGRFDIEAQVIGRVESSKIKEVEIISSHGTFKYQ